VTARASILPSQEQPVKNYALTSGTIFVLARA